ncbi:hypothetical protein A3Q56_08292, partial [Intoshia linei]
MQKRISRLYSSFRKPNFLSFFENIESCDVNALQIKINKYIIRNLRIENVALLFYNESDNSFYVS